MAVPPGLPRLSEERNVVNVRQGSDKVLLEIDIKNITSFTILLSRTVAQRLPLVMRDLTTHLDASGVHAGQLNFKGH